MTPTQEVIQAAIEAALARNPGFVSITEVCQFIPRNQGYVIPARSTLIADAIVARYPQATDIGGGVYEVKQVVETVEVVAEVEDGNIPEADVEWTATNGQRIQVWTGNRPWLWTVAVDGKFSGDVKVEAVPAKFAEAARKNGVVAMLGRVGLTAERKAALQSLDRSGLKSQPVG